MARTMQTGKYNNNNNKYIIFTFRVTYALYIVVERNTKDVLCYPRVAHVVLFFITCLFIVFFFFVAYRLVENTCYSLSSSSSYLVFTQMIFFF